MIKDEVYLHNWSLWHLVWIWWAQQWASLLYPDVTMVPKQQLDQSNPTYGLPEQQIIHVNKCDVMTDP